MPLTLTIFSVQRLRGLASVIRKRVKEWLLVSVNLLPFLWVKPFAWWAFLIALFLVLISVFLYLKRSQPYRRRRDVMTAGAFAFAAIGFLILWPFFVIRSSDFVYISPASSLFESRFIIYNSGDGGRVLVVSDPVRRSVADILTRRSFIHSRSIFLAHYLNSSYLIPRFESVIRLGNQGAVTDLQAESLEIPAMTNGVSLSITKDDPPELHLIRGLTFPSLYHRTIMRLPDIPPWEAVECDAPPTDQQLAYAAALAVSVDSLACGQTEDAMSLLARLSPPSNLEAARRYSLVAQVAKYKWSGNLGGLQALSLNREAFRAAKDAFAKSSTRTVTPCEDYVAGTIRSTFSRWPNKFVQEEALLNEKVLGVAYFEDNDVEESPALRAAAIHSARLKLLKAVVDGNDDSAIELADAVDQGTDVFSLRRAHWASLPLADFVSTVKNAKGPTAELRSMYWYGWERLARTVAMWNKQLFIFNSVDTKVLSARLETIREEKRLLIQLSQALGNNLAAKVSDTMSTAAKSYLDNSFELYERVATTGSAVEDDRARLFAMIGVDPPPIGTNKFGPYGNSRVGPWWSSRFTDWFLTCCVAVMLETEWREKNGKAPTQSVIAEILSADSILASDGEGNDFAPGIAYTLALARRHPDLCPVGFSAIETKLRARLKHMTGFSESNVFDAFDDHHSSNSDLLDSYRLAADAGNTKAMLHLGIIHLHGDGVPTDPVAGVEWLTRAAVAGNDTAMWELGLFYHMKSSSDQDNKTGMEWFRRAAEAGNEDAMCALGVGYAQGRGMPKDNDKALEWLIKAANGGNKAGMFRIGLIYAGVTGYPVDYEKAAIWFQKGADAGDAYAMFCLGRLYQYGHGVTASAKDAMKWFQKAADQGDADAMDTIGELFEKGQGVVKNDTVAKEWRDKATKARRAITSPTTGPATYGNDLPAPNRGL